MLEQKSTTDNREEIDNCKNRLTALGKYNENSGEEYIGCYLQQGKDSQMIQLPDKDCRENGEDVNKSRKNNQMGDGGMNQLHLPLLQENCYAEG